MRNNRKLMLKSFGFLYILKPKTIQNEAFAVRAARGGKTS